MRLHFRNQDGSELLNDGVLIMVYTGFTRIEDVHNMLAEDVYFEIPVKVEGLCLLIRI